METINSNLSTTPPAYMIQNGNNNTLPSYYTTSSMTQIQTSIHDPPPYSSVVLRLTSPLNHNIIANETSEINLNSNNANKI